MKRAERKAKAGPFNNMVGYGKYKVFADRVSFRSFSLVR
jgi:hypothetical protein